VEIIMNRPLTRLALMLSVGLVGASSVLADGPCKGVPKDRLVHPMTPLARPALGQAVRDPEFRTTIRRITAAGPVAGSDAVIKPMYSTISAWNADESRLILYHVGRGHELYDGRTYAFIRALPIAPTDIEQVYWDGADPDVFFFPTGNRLVRYHVSTGVQDTVHTFTSCTDSLTGGSDPMFMAWDGSAIGLKCGTQAFFYRIDTNTVATASNWGADTPQVAPSGTLAYVQGYVLDSALRPVRQLDLANPFDHASLGQNDLGHDSLATVVFDPGPGGSDIGSLVTFDLQDGSSKVLVGPATGFPYPPSGTHVSTAAHKRPAWTFLSIVGDPAGLGVLDNELVLANSKNGRVCRIAHHHSFGDNNTHLQSVYWAEPHVVGSPKATRAVFASDWGNGTSVDTYVVELPSYRPLTLSATPNAASYIAGSVLSVSVTVDNQGSPETPDLFVLQVLPDGDQVLSLTGTGAVPGRLSQPSTLVPWKTRMDLRVPFHTDTPAFYSHTWNGTDVPGTYSFAMMAVRPGTLADNRFDPGDVVTSGSATVTFAR